MRHCRPAVARVVLALAALSPRAAAAQLPLAPVPTSGQPVYPVFEGWYRNPDGSFSISFGYFNRNSEEVLEIPVGPDNFIRRASRIRVSLRTSSRAGTGAYSR
jgi:hypothetical protein